MSKAKEIVALHQFAANLGENSYTGGWLKEQLPYIESAIRADLPVGERAMTLSEMQAHVARIVSEAEAQAAAIINRANAAAKADLAEAASYIARQHEHAKRALQDIVARF